VKAHLSDTLLRLTAIAATVLTLMAALMPFSYASAAPDQGDGYWTDSFIDTTGVSTSTNISVSGGDVRLNTSTTILQVPNSCSDTTYANAQTNEWYSQWTPPGSGTVTVTRLWYWQVDNSLSSSETLYMAMYIDGSGYTKISGSDATLTGTGATGWISANVSTPFTITLGQSYWIGLASASGTSYGLARDNSANCANYPPTGSGSYYPTNNYVLDASVPTGASRSTNKYMIPGITYTTFNSSGSLNSVNISPSNLQSWGNFYANGSAAWPYYKPISTTGTGTTLTDYQINVSVAYVSGKMNSNFSDLRFKDGSGNELNYWIESYNASTSAQVWVKIPTINASGTTAIYMYYGNPLASSTSNESNVFDYVDRGDQVSSWSTYGTASQSATDGNPAPSYYANSSSGNYLNRNVSLVPGRIVTFNAKTNGLGNFYFLTNSAGQGQMYRLDTRASPEHSGFATTTNWTVWTAPSSGFQAIANQWYKLTMVITSATSATFYYNQTTSSSPSGFGTLLGTYTITNNGGYIGLVGDALGSSYATFIDNIVVRKYAATVPTISSGSEIALIITYKILNAANDSVLCTISTAQAAAGYNISSCAGSTSSIKLRAEFSTSNTSQTPILYDWGVTWTSVIQTWIDIHAPTDISSWDLYPGTTNTKTGTLNVTVSSPSVNWLVTANDSDTVNTGGFMALLNGSSYNSPLIHLSKAMNVSAGSATNVTGNYSVTLTIGGTIATGTGNASPPITFTQEVTWDDVPGTYQIVVTFTAMLE